MISHEYSADASAIWGELMERQVMHLCHFTTLKNACSILRMGGLYSRKWLEEHKIEADFQDDSRYEGRHFLNLSITEPNKWMWQRMASRAPEKKWCVFRIRPDVCVQAGVKFATANAGAYNVRCNGTSEGVDGLRTLFESQVADTQGLRLRLANRPINRPTSDQAEVLCPYSISLEMVMDLVVRDEIDKAYLLEQASLNEHWITINPTLFPFQLSICA